MPVDNIPPEVARQFARINDRLLTLEQRKLPPSTNAVSGLSLPLPFSFPGLNVTGAFAGPYEYRGRAVQFGSIIVKRRVAGAVDMTFDFTIDGSSVYAPLLPAGAITATYAVSFGVGDGNVLGVELIDAGDGSFSMLELVPAA